jgi:rhodanese-related sulfurtransferase
MTNEKSTTATVTVHEAKDQLGEALLLDVRTPAEYEEIHVAGSLLHPLGDLDPGQVREHMKGKSRCLVLCRSGQRARQAADQLAAAGLAPVAVVEGGVLAWDGAGLPTNRGRKTMSLERQVRIAAGALVFTGALLGFFVNPLWMALSGFVGAGLVFAGLTDTCGMGMLIAKMPWNNRMTSIVSRTH